MGTDDTVDTIDEGIESAKKVFENLDLEELLTTVLILVIGYIAIRIVCGLLGRAFKKSGRLDASLQKYIVRIIKILLYFSLFIICASHLGIPINSLITILASLGLAISLALQDSLKNVAGGIFLLSSKPFSTGDFIELGSVSGTVAEVGVIHTILITADNKKIYVPNSKLSEETVVNYSALDKRRIDLLFSVSYDCELKLARQIIYDAIMPDERVIKDPEPFVRVWELSSSSVNIMARIWCRSDDFLELRSAIIETVKLSLDEAGIKIPFNQLVVEVKKDREADGSFSD